MSKKKSILYTIQDKYFDNINFIIDSGEEEIVKLKAWRRVFLRR